MRRGIIASAAAAAAMMFGGIVSEAVTATPAPRPKAARRRRAPHVVTRMNTSYDLNRARRWPYADTYRQAADISAMLGTRTGPLR